MGNINSYTLGIDATNLRGGGGVTHLVELLRAAQPLVSGFDHVVVWGGKSTLSALDDSLWLSKRNPSALDQGLVQRTLWQSFCLSKAAHDEGCSVLFVPGGSFLGNFHPVVTMNQNLLPFEMVELLRYGWSLFTIKLLLLRFTQSRSFRKADGIIFLTEYARKVVLQHTGRLHGKASIIPHGFNPRFNKAPKIQRSITEYDDAHPYRVLYVSIVDQYKHQWHLVEGIAILRKQGFPIALDLVGPSYPPALNRLNQTIDSLDANRSWVRYHGAIPYEDLHSIYADADMATWGSTCETFGIILLEAMASGLPIACSSRGSMPELLGQAGAFFNPEQPNDIARALRELIESPQYRTELARASYDRAQRYSWQRCADDTFRFLFGLVKQRKKGVGDV